MDAHGWFRFTAGNSAGVQRAPLGFDRAWLLPSYLFSCKCKPRFGTRPGAATPSECSKRHLR